MATRWIVLSRFVLARIAFAHQFQCLAVVAQGFIGKFGLSDRAFLRHYPQATLAAESPSLDTVLISTKKSIKARTLGARPRLLG